MLLTQHPQSAEYARWRFPVVFLDEMQDTSEMQSGVLARLFPVNKCALRQRFGDINQAIYDYGQSTSATDTFPGTNHRTVANSLRFGPSIAKKAEPFAPVKTEGGLVGDGPTRDIARAISTPAYQHTIFVFTDSTAANVLPAFGRLLLSTFSESAIAIGWFRARAIGRIGAPSDKVDKKPRNVGDYWAEYQPKVSKLNARPEKLAGYLHLARRRHGEGRECAEAVRTAVRGLIELMDLVRPGGRDDRGHGLRMLRQAMANQPEAIHALEQGLWRWCVAPAVLTEKAWPGEVEFVRGVMRTVVGEEWNIRADAFCEWSSEFHPDGAAVEPSRESAINHYILRDGTRQVEIGLGTVHGAKGQTHTATLVLETHFKKHDLGDLLSCLGAPSKALGKNPGVERLERMRILYTAMTRPTHLLCVAIRAEALTQDPGTAKNTEQLRASGWTITDLG
jgi:DNA helicase-2/ATP-dependent DNA helicase PcrA